MIMYLDLLLTLACSVDAQYINIPLQKQALATNILGKRQVSNDTLTLADQGSSYTANISFGTPAQVVSLILDTGSPLTWVNAQNVSLFTPGQATTASQQTQGASICQSFSCLNPTADSSLTVPLNSTIFDIQYVDGTESIGRIVQDTMSFQGLDDKTFQFGLVEYFYSPNGVGSALGGILGLSPPSLVASFDNLTAALTATGTATQTAYTPQTILEQLQDAGAISSTAFSLFLSDESEGQLTIGGIDSGRYTGPLTVVPIAIDPETVATGQSFYVTLGSVGTGGANQVSINELVVLDSGTTSMYLPAEAVESLASTLDGFFVPYSETTGLLAIPCSTSTTIDFYFSNSAVIKVPTSEILESRLSQSQAKRLGIKATGDVCVLSLFGIADSDTYLLGDSFLRSAYVVYDSQQNQIALGQAQYDGVSNLQPITSGEFGIPGAVYNTSSPDATNVALVPSATRTVSLASGAGRTTAGRATLTFTGGISGTLTQTGLATNPATASNKSFGVRRYEMTASLTAFVTMSGLLLASFLFL